MTDPSAEFVEEVQKLADDSSSSSEEETEMTEEERAAKEKKQKLKRTIDDLEETAAADAALLSDVISKDRAEKHRREFQKIMSEMFADLGGRPKSIYVTLYLM